MKQMRRLVGKKIVSFSSDVGECCTFLPLVQYTKYRVPDYEKLHQSSNMTGQHAYIDCAMSRRGLGPA